MTSRNRLAANALGVFLFLTGGSALVYQVLWSRYLDLLLGSSALAVVVVLAAFMGGLAIGSWTLGRLADRPIRRLTLYAWLEIGVGVYCLFFPGLLNTLEGPYLKLVSPLFLTSPALFTASRFVFAALLLVPPTVLMGGTLPAASRFLLGLEPGVRKAVARLYWLNSLGAVAGAMTAGFYLVPTLGLDLSMDVAAAVNILVGIAAIAVRTRVQEDPHAVAEADPAEVPLPARAARAALAAVTISGFAALVLEVAWTRLLALTLGGSTYAFTLMLATFILGIALGSRWVAGPRFAGRDPVVWLGTFLAAVAVLLAISLPLYTRLPWLFLQLRTFVNPVPQAYRVYQAMLFAVCILVMLLPTLAMGATLPLASRIASRDPSVQGRKIGLTWALNTLGTLLGALLGGLVLLPRLGLQGTFSLVACLYAVSAVCALLGVDILRRRPAQLAAVAAVVSLVAVVLEPRWPMERLVAGDYRVRAAAPTLASWLDIRAKAFTIDSHYDGATCSVSVVVTRQDGVRSLRVNGKPDASNGGDMPTQIISGHIAPLLRPGAKQALLIGIGSGATMGALLSHPDLRVDAVEIEAGVVEAARRHFADINDKALENPRARVFVEDAKSVLQLAPRRYDVIISEPSNPWLAGIGGLFTRDFFERAKASLTAGGLMGQWVHTYEIDDESIRIVLRTFRSAFPHVTVWNVGPSDYLLLGGEKPLALDPAALEAEFAIPSVRRSLERVGVTTVHALLAHQALSTKGVEAAAGQGPLNTDQFPVLEFAAPRGFFVGGNAAVIEGADERVFLSGQMLLLHEYLEKRPLDREAALSVARAVRGKNEFLEEAALWFALGKKPESFPTASSLWGFLERKGRIAAAASVLGAVRPASPEEERGLASLRLAAAMNECTEGRSNLFDASGCEKAIRQSEELLQRSADPKLRQEALYAQARAQLWRGRVEVAAGLFAQLLQSVDAPPRLRADWLAGSAAALMRLGRPAEAEKAAREAVRLRPDHRTAWRLLALAGRSRAAEPPSGAAPSE